MNILFLIFISSGINYYISLLICNQVLRKNGYSTKYFDMSTMKNLKKIMRTDNKNKKYYYWYTFSIILIPIVVLGIVFYSVN